MQFIPNKCKEYVIDHRSADEPGGIYKPDDESKPIKAIFWVYKAEDPKYAEVWLDIIEFNAKTNQEGKINVEISIAHPEWEHQMTIEPYQMTMEKLRYAISKIIAVLN